MGGLFLTAIFFDIYPPLSPFDALDESDPLELSGSYLVWDKLEWLGYNLMKIA